MDCVVINRSNPNLGFGQIVKLKNIRLTLVVKAYGDMKTYIVSKDEIWPLSKAHDYESYNSAVFKVNNK